MFDALENAQKYTLNHMTPVSVADPEKIHLGGRGGNNATKDL